MAALGPGPRSSTPVLRVALTGNIASGKSTVARVWKELGGRVVEADELARKAVLPGSQALQRIAARWGPGILLPSGELDRAAMRDVVFRDAEERRHLEGIVHPEVNRLREEEHRRAAREGERIVVSDIPLLFEVGLQDEFDLVVLVDAPDEVRRQRLQRDRGLDPYEVQRMIDSQMPSERKRERADVVIENLGTLAELESRARAVWLDLRERAQGTGGG
jgi:dephospho-CoA kinase